MSRYAYVTVLYGSNVYLTGALVLGYSLWRTKTTYDRVILVTPDVKDEYKTFLRQVYTKVITIDYMQVNPSIFLSETTRFRDVFTKLEAISLIEYDKIILLDLDMIICKKIDHLFKLRAPAAVLKGKELDYGVKIPSWMICDNKGNMKGSINAGLMLLKPDLNELNSIKEDVLNNPNMMKFRYPEQDYLSLRYCNRWTSITFQYNFQFGLIRRVQKLQYTIDDIYVIHYSSSFKPWNVLTNKVPDNISLDFVAEWVADEKQFMTLHKHYYETWIKAYNFVKKWFEKKKMVIPY